MSGNWYPEDFGEGDFGNTYQSDQNSMALEYREVTFTNDQDETLLMRLRGTAEEIEQYLDAIEGRIAFFVGGAPPSEMEGEITEEPEYGADDFTALHIEFRLLGDEGPRELGIWIDPLLDQVIGAYHRYHTYGGPLSATIHADMGSLAMRLAGFEVSVGAGNPFGTLNGQGVFRYTIEIEGKASVNQYDLYIKSFTA